MITTDGQHRRTTTSGSTRDRVVHAAADLLQHGGAAAVTTRAVATAAGVQAPAIYRLFGDKDGLLDAVAEHVFARYVADKALVAPADPDPVRDLHTGWDHHVAFGLANPSLFALLADPARADSPAIAAGHQVLRDRIRRLADAGRLRVGEADAVRLLQAAGTGVVLTLIPVPPATRDLRLADAMYDAVVRAILTDQPAGAVPGVVGAAVTLRAGLTGIEVLTPAEQSLLAEWLDRVAAG